MPSRDQIRDLVERYVAALDGQDLDTIVGLFTEDAVQDDPVGEGANVGHAAIRAFFTERFLVAFDARLDGPPTIHGSFAAFRIAVEIPAGRTPFRILITDLVEVTPDLRFRTLKAVPDAKVLNP
ncbi:MAG: steroid delta-isomerase [Nocardioides sp.]|nr:steroid delta-isomerase [Nocardioides sp.]